MLDDRRVMTPTIYRRCLIEAHLDGGDGRYYAITMGDGGKLITHNPGAPELNIPQRIWGIDVCAVLNKHLHHDGGWMVVFTCPAPQVPHAEPDDYYNSYRLIWLDQDGDPQFSVEWVKNDGELLTFTDVMLAGLYYTAQKCEAAWEIWHKQMIDVLNPAEGQTYKKALGEAPKSSRH